MKFSGKSKRAKTAGANWLSDIILGTQDGLVSILGLILGLAAAADSSRVILAGGFATAVSETISMAAVAYTTKMALRDQFRAGQNQEKDEIKQAPEEETSEIRAIFISKGFSGELLSSIVSHITADETLWLKTMMTEELKLSNISKKDVVVGTAVVGVSTLVGSTLPLFSFFFFGKSIALAISIVTSAIVLGAVGVYKAKVTTGNPYVSALTLIGIGLGAALVGFGIGLIFR